jgi:hypothetical protein
MLYQGVPEQVRGVPVEEGRQERHRDDAWFDRHYSNQGLDEPHQRVLDLLAAADDHDDGLDASMRLDVHIVSSSRRKDSS